MKTDISIPNPVFRSAEKLAKKLGISLSELYTAALMTYVTEHEKEAVTETLDRVYSSNSSQMEPELVQMQVAVLGGEEW
ncbi:MAG: ChpI protein [Chloroflexota bacterium]